MYYSNLNTLVEASERLIAQADDIVANSITAALQAEDEGYVCARCAYHGTLSQVETGLAELQRDKELPLTARASLEALVEQALSADRHNRLRDALRSLLALLPAE